MRSLALTLILSTCLIPPVLNSAWAQEMPVGKTTMGMRHMDITKDKAPPAPAPAAAPAPVAAPAAAPAPAAEIKTETKPGMKTLEKAEEQQPLAKPAPVALKPEEAVKKLDTLTEWPYYTDLLTIKNDTALDSVLHQIQIDPGSVPPKGLLYTAKALTERNRMEEAAFFYYAAQLRESFDAARFPAYTLESEKPEVKDSRTEDQRGKPPEPAQPVVINPHEPITMLAFSVGPKISKWAMSDPVKLETVLAKVRTWDMATPYAYLPDYDTSHAVEFDKWPVLLQKSRNDYFTRARQVSEGLSRMRPAAPVSSFGARP